jgi:RNA polymerase sigma-70 factor (ECF subfamily)
VVERLSDGLQEPIDVLSTTREIIEMPDTFVEFYHRHINGVYRYLLVHTGNARDAQELAAQTFQAVRDDVERQDLEASIAHLFGVARRKLANYTRRSHKTTLPNGHAGLAANEAANGQLHLDQVMQAFSVLPADQAEALALRVFGGLSAAETGQVMGKSEQAIKLLVYHAIRDLQMHSPSTSEADEWIKIEMKL